MSQFQVGVWLEQPRVHQFRFNGKSFISRPGPENQGHREQKKKTNDSQTDTF